MHKLTKQQTIHLDPAIYKALKAKSLATGLSMSDLINQALCLDMLEDLLAEEKYKIKSVIAGTLTAGQ